MVFKEISDESYGKAFAVLHAPRSELSPEQLALRSASQAAVSGLVNGTPLLGRYETSINQDDFAIPGRPHHNALHTSIARLIEQPGPDDLQKTALTIAADTVTQVDSRHMESAIRLGFIDSLDDECQRICKAAEQRAQLKDEIGVRAVGSYHRLPVEAQQQIKNDLDRPAKYIPQVEAAITRSAHHNHQLYSIQASLGR